MVWAVMMLLAGIAVFAVMSRNYKNGLFRKLDRQRHPLRPLYPMCARITDMYRGFFGNRARPYMEDMMKSLYVKENIDVELYLHQVEKGSVMMLTAICAMLCFLTASLISGGSEPVNRLERGGYGQGARNYELEVSYRDEEELMSIDVDQIRLDESHILELFDRSREEVYRQMLGENESAQEVSKPLNFISSCNGFQITWNIEDTGSVGYDGKINPDDAENRKQPINIYAVFSLDGVSEIFNFPVMLVNPVLSEREKLLRRIMEEIEKSSDAYSSIVPLPDKLDGERITFYTVAGKNGTVILILAAIAVMAIMLFYDKKLETTVNNRKEQLMMDFARIVSKLSLLYDAGLSVHGAFERIVADHEKGAGNRQKQGIHKILLHHGKKYPSDYAYLEMKLALEKIRNGESEGRAYAQFGRRCGLQPYIKLGNLLERNLSKGTKGMQGLLKDEVNNAYDQRKRLARKKGEQASTKMLIPMTMMLLVVIAIIAFPALLAIGI